MDLTNKQQLIDYLKFHGLYTKHSLGQNFLVDKNALEKIVGAAELVPPLTSPCKGGEQTGDLVIEVGPGLGVLTQELVKKAGKVIAVELDEKLVKLLAQKLSGTNYQLSSNDQLNNFQIDKLDDHWKLKIDNSELEIIQSDILKVNIPELVGDRKYKVVANIPYYITSKIIQLFLTQENKPETIVVLTQKEVAERICASPGNMSVLSVSVQVYGDPEIIDIVPASSFFPAPEVDSAILRIRIKNSELRIQPEQEKDFFRTVKVGFANRRKTLVNNLAAGFHLDKEKAKSIISGIGLDENVRAQELSLEEWGELTKLLGLSL